MIEPCAEITNINNEIIFIFSTRERERHPEACITALARASGGLFGQPMTIAMH
jgi:hypothetical protein